MAFVKFTNHGKSFEPKVSINPRGMIGFSQGSVRRFTMSDYSFCVFYYDEDEKKIGIELVNDEAAEGAVRLRNRVIGSDVAAKSFLSYYNILPETTSMYELSVGNESNWLIIDLKTAREREFKSAPTASHTFYGGGQASSDSEERDIPE